MTSPLPYDPRRLAQCAGDIIANVRELSDRGWTPATSSNFSQRIDEQHVAITVSGRDKGRLTEADIMVVDVDGLPALPALSLGFLVPNADLLWARWRARGATDVAPRA